MPYIYPPQPLSGGGKQPRRSFESEYAVEEELGQAFGTSNRWNVPLDQSARWSDGLDSDDDFAMQARLHMSFDGRAYPPVPPDASTLSRPTDDWFSQPLKSGRNSVVAPESLMPSYTQNDVPPTFAVEPYPPVSYHAAQYPIAPAQPSYPLYDPAYAWSPSCAYPAAQPMDYRAPMLHPRHIQLPEPPVTPHDTYRYPASHAEHIYVTALTDTPSKEMLNSAFAAWYVDQVVDLLVKPGQFRPGVGGSSEEHWGVAGREKDDWERVGRAAPDYSKPWGRMGMTSTPMAVQHRVTRTRFPESEPSDPWNVLWSNSPKRSSTLVTFVLDMLQRMTISPVAVVSAVWFLTGMGLHEGDGQKGAELREFLRGQPWADLEAVEKRVATLGLLLAGKWLDDNSFLSKSWSEVTSIPVKQIDRMERCALQDLHFSLHVPTPSWVDHVNKLFSSLICKPQLDELDAVVVSSLDHLVTEAREAELSDTKSFAQIPSLERRLSAQELLASADQGISRDWSAYSRSYSFDRKSQRASSHELDAELEAERTVAALVDEDMEDDDDEEFLDYDGAKRWLPSESELRRSSSHSSSKSYDSVTQWRQSIYHPDSQPFAAHRNSSASSFDFVTPRKTSDGAYDHPSTDCPQCAHSTYHTPTLAADVYSTPPEPTGWPTTLTMPTQAHRYKDLDVYLEPGISIVKAPPTTQHRTSDAFGVQEQCEYGGFKRWGIAPARW